MGTTCWHTWKTEHTAVVKLFPSIVCSSSFSRHHHKTVFSDTSYHLGPGWHLHCKHTQASAAAAVPALLVVHVDSYPLIGLQAQKGHLEMKH